MLASVDGKAESRAATTCSSGGGVATAPDGPPIAYSGQSSNATLTVMDYSLLKADDVLGRLNSSATGLSQAEAARRLGVYGPNELPRSRAGLFWRVLISPFASVFVLILFTALAVSLWLGHTL